MVRNEETKLLNISKVTPKNFNTSTAHAHFEPKAIFNL